MAKTPEEDWPVPLMDTEPAPPPSKNSHMWEGEVPKEIPQAIDFVAGLAEDDNE
jgi:hypothetical protein